MSPGLRSRISVACHGRQYPAGSRRTLEQAQMGWPRQPLGRQLFLCAASTLSPSSKMMAALGAEPQLRAWRKPSGRTRRRSETSCCGSHGKSSTRAQKRVW